MTPDRSDAEQMAAPEGADRRLTGLFRNLVLTERESHVGRTGTTLVTSIILHSVLIVAVAVLPLLAYDANPPPQAVQAFFVTPLDLQPPPPPPPPPPAAARSVSQPAPKIDVQQTEGFVAPIEVPAEILPEEGLDLGVDGGVAGGVEGGVPGGVVGGVVGGLPEGAAPPPTKAIRVGGMVSEPRKVKHVPPVYPGIAADARIQGVVILEATVSTQGSVSQVKVLRSIPLLDGAAVDAVKKWVYTPTLLNGVPVPVIVTVTVVFELA
jgi:protein TonB